MRVLVRPLLSRSNELVRDPASASLTLSLFSPCRPVARGSNRITSTTTCTRPILRARWRGEPQGSRETRDARV